MLYENTKILAQVLFQITNYNRAPTLIACAFESYFRRHKIFMFFVCSYMSSHYCITLHIIVNISGCSFHLIVCENANFC